MNPGVVEHQRPASDARWRRTSISLAEIAEHLECALADKQSLEQRLADLLEENRKLSLRCDEAAAEESRSKTEIADLQFQVADGLKRLEVKTGMGGRQTAELAARERLLKDDCERRVQAIQVELNTERHKFARRLEKMELDRAACICRGMQIKHVEHDSVLASSVLPEGWKIRNAK